MLGSGYKKELLEQVSPENLPVQFGGTCKCEGGCELSDMGPWREAEWAKPAKWEVAKEKKENGVSEESGEKKEEEGEDGAAQPSA